MPMHAAHVDGPGQTPVLRVVSEPAPAPGERLVTVTAAALNQVTRSRASGRHYSVAGGFPFGVGIDGVGRDAEGRRVYFVLPRAPFGSMAERTVVDAAHCLELPEALDDVTAAAIANPGMSSWAALTERAKLRPGETVLVNGATGISGRLAVQIAKHLGAGKVIATGRNAQALRELEALGADVTLVLDGNAEAFETAARAEFAAGVDVVLDYLWGSSAESLLSAGAKAGSEAVPIRFVQIGEASGPVIRLPSAVLRSSALTLMGSGIGSIPPQGLIRAIAGVLRAAIPAGLRIATRPVPFADLEAAWLNDEEQGRTVFTMSGQPR